MTHRERFYATLERRPVDRPASWLGMPVTDAYPGLFAHFGVSSLDELKIAIDDDIYPVDVPYHDPPANHIACAFDFAKAGSSGYEERTLTTPGIFEDCTDPACVAGFDWPDSAEHMAPAECRRVVDAVPDDCAVLGVMWSAHFQDACAAFGMENALITMLTVPDVFQAVIDRITEFYIAANKIFYEATKGRLDAVLIGNDFGSQTALMLSPDLIRKHVWVGTRRLVEQAKSYDLKVLHHSCGAIAEIVPDLIEMGVDAIHPIQALATGMDASSLKRQFGEQVSFCGGVDAQELLVNGSPDEVAVCANELRALFPTGLVISPSHEAILPDIPPANIEALFRAVNG